MGNELVIEEKYYEVVRRSLELLDTIQEALLYVTGSVGKDEYQTILALFNDVVEAIRNVDFSLDPIISGLNDETLIASAYQLVSAINVFIKHSEDEECQFLIHDVRQEVMPAFRGWYGRLEELLMPKIVA